MKSSKKAVALFAGVALAVAGLVGCSDQKPADSAGEAAEEAVEVEEAEAAVEEIAEEEADAEAEVEAAVDAATDFMVAFFSLFSGDDAAAKADLDESDGDAEEFFDSLQVAKYLTFVNMTEEEAYEFKWGFYQSAVMGLFESSEEADFTIQLPGEATVDGDEAEVNTNGGIIRIFMEDGETAEEDLGEFGLGYLKLLKEDGVWKVDAQAITETVEALQPES